MVELKVSLAAALLVGVTIGVVAHEHGLAARTVVLYAGGAGGSVMLLAAAAPIARRTGSRPDPVTQHALEQVIVAGLVGLALVVAGLITSSGGEIGWGSALVTLSIALILTGRTRGA